MRQVENVLREMLHDRGFVPITERVHDNVFQSNKVPLVVGERETDNKKCFVYWLWDPKLGINPLRELIQKAEGESGFHSLIIVCNQGATPFTERTIRDRGWDRVVNVFKTQEVQRNVTRHSLVPRHVLCSSDEMDMVRKRYNIDNVDKLPYISDRDPVMRYYNFGPGGVVRIERVSGLLEMQRYYRHIVSLDSA